ncbi:MAG: hypothetical protein IJ848_00265, partial [Alphaproteobacteria bacterium]|nr:hypothetical protein [Alphaproteobacteria bacterium]
MNKSLRVISLSLITVLGMSCVSSTNAQCVSSGFGVGLTLGAHKNGVKFGVDNLNKLLKSKNEYLISQLKAAIANTNKKFEKPNTAETEMVAEEGKTYDIDTYTPDQNDASVIAGAEANKLPSGEDVTTLSLNTRKYKSDNPTKYIIVSSGDAKYDSKGMHSAADDATSIEKQPIVSNSGILEYNGYTGEQADGADDSDATVTANYAHITNEDGEASYLTPKSYFILQNMDSDTAPTHVLLSDLSGDKTTYSFLASVLGNKTTLEEYQKQFKDDELFIYNKKYYIDTVKHNDLGLGDTFVDSAISTLNTNTAASQTFKDVSKWSFDIGANVFYQYRIYDWFVRAGVFGNFPVANKTVSLMENTDKTNNSNDKTKSSDNN